MRAIVRCSVFISADLKRQLDALSVPRLRTTMPVCACGARDWVPCSGDPLAPKAYFTCDRCSRRRSATRVLASVTSATDGSGVADRMIAEYLARPGILTLHVPATSVMIGLYVPRKSHTKAKALAEKRAISLSQLLASIIAERVSPQVERAA